jgi:hypothetical protein
MQTVHAQCFGETLTRFTDRTNDTAIRRPWPPTKSIKNRRSGHKTPLVRVACGHLADD